MIDMHNLPVFIGDTHEYWQHSSLPAPHEFHAQMTKGLPTGTRLEVDMNPNGTLKAFDFRYDDYKNREHFRFKNKFDGDRVIHYEHEASESIQGQGLSKALHRNLFPFYQQQGFAEVSLSAEKLGIFSHHRLGFVPNADKPEWAQQVERMKTRIDFMEAHPSQTEDQLTAPYFSMLRETCQEYDPKCMWSLVDQKSLYQGIPVGKVLTFPRQSMPIGFPRALADSVNFPDHFPFNSRLDMKDDACLARLDGYLFAGEEPILGLPKKAVTSLPSFRA